MVNWKTISDKEAGIAMAHSEFPASVIHSSRNVAVVLTQGWCSQWLILREALMQNFPAASMDVDIHVFVYNKSPLFSEFLNFKETVLGNNHIPYIRYYKVGVLKNESNYLPAEDFFQQFD